MTTALWKAKNRGNLNLSRRLILSLLTLIILAVSVIGVSFLAYDKIGRTPGELMDYAERRLEGHPKLEFFALPAIAVLRNWLDEPSLKDRMAIRFDIPPPPARLTLSKKILETEQHLGNTIHVGKTRPIMMISEAAKMAKDGDIVEIDEGEYYGDVAVWPQKKLTIRAVGGNARIRAAGRSAEGKAIWVIRNGDFTIENIDFIGAKVSDKNGAGIRFENGHLRVNDCLFWGNENGILSTGNNESRNSSIEIINSEFGYNGAGDGQSHNIYIGAIASLKVSGSYFHHANVGHLLKSRAAFNEITYNRLTDESGGRASYEVEFPNGGFALLLGNIIQQNRETENSTMIAYGKEGYKWKENKLILASNTIVNDHPLGGTFLSISAGIKSVISTNNLLVGKGKYQSPIPITSENDQYVDWSVFAKAIRHDYRIVKGQSHTNNFTHPAVFSNVDLIPKSEYHHPRSTITLTIAPHLPGALQIQ